LCISITTPPCDICRKNRAKPGRPLGSASNKADASTSTPKRKKVARDDAALNTSPAMNTRRQLALSKQAEAGTSQEVSTTPNMEVATPTKK